jgi:Ni,Fe-hydrogenase III large subunit
MPSLIDLTLEGRKVGHHGPWPRVLVDASVWSFAASELAHGRWSLLGLWGEPETVHVAIMEEHSAGIAVVSLECPERRFPSVGKHHPPALRLERTIRDLYGLSAEGAPDVRPWLDHNRWGVRFPLGDRIDALPNAEPYHFLAAEGDGLHQIPVGPVHAGIIEPGHFRFQCAGEEVLHLEIALGYQHRGVEAALVGGPHRATRSQLETVAGDTTIAHATAYATVLETLAGAEAPLREQWLRALALELERLANHVGDLGAMANDVAFLPTAAACGKLRGDFLNLTALLCGNRFGRGLVLPGGAGWDLEAERAAVLGSRLELALDDVERALGWLSDSASVAGRFERTGALTQSFAAELGLVGPAARACGLVRDVRYDHPIGWHRFAPVPIAVWPDGDVFARAQVRSLEIQRSGSFLREELRAQPDGPVKDELGPLRAGQLAVALVEGWRGEVCHVALTDGAGRIRHYKIIDPSFHNWAGLAIALRGQAISDFPLCNKSFNLSYCGFDL